MATGERSSKQRGREGEKKSDRDNYPAYIYIGKKDKW
jgi:hypothetical protein